jgi:threonine dehydratase
MTDQLRLPAYDDVLEAAAAIVSHAVRTPLLESPFLNERAGARVLLKAEVLQRTGSFKFRGAYNCVSRTDPRIYPGGVVACSSGNHAQGVAEAARICGIDAVIVMPADAPAIKIERTRRSGAEIVLYDRHSENRDAIAAAIASERKMAFVAPFDNFYVIAGQGTVGLELAEQAKAAGAELEAVLVPASGGGLIAGTALAVATAMPEARVYTVEPAGFDDYARSLRSGVRESNAPDARSICDALLMPHPGELTFAMNKERLAGGLTVSDDEVRAAVAFAFRELKLTVEPGGAVALAALLSEHYLMSGGPVALVLSGGNIDPPVLAECLAAA